METISGDEIMALPLDGSIRIQLPLIVTFSSRKPLQVAALSSPADILACYKMMSDLAQEDVALGTDEFNTLQDFKDYLEEDRNQGYVIKDHDSAEVLGFMNNIPSPLSRSTKPFISAGYFVFDAKTRLTGIAQYFGHLKLLLCLMEGYHGLVGRVCSLNKREMVFRQRKTLGYNLGLIPFSNNMNGALIDDIIVYGDFSLFSKDKESLRTALSRLHFPLPVCPSLATTLPDSWNVLFSSCTNILPTMHITISKATLPEKLEAEKLFNQAARSGEGFALDEFTFAGALNRRLFKKSITLVVKQHDDVIAAAVVGPMGISRSPNPNLLNLYVVVLDKYRRKGVADALLKACFRACDDWGYLGFLIDVFELNFPGLQLFRKYCFNVTGSIPYAGHVRNQGFQSALLMYLMLSNASHTPSQILSKI